jgi:hypothetical protein
MFGLEFVDRFVVEFVITLVACCRSFVSQQTPAKPVYHEAFGVIHARGVYSQIQTRSSL